MLTIIFGAGASHDIAPITAGAHRNKTTWNPPLTAELFAPEKIWSVENNVITPPRNLAPVLQRVRQETRVFGIEGALERLKSEAVNNPKEWAQLLAIQEWLGLVISRCTEESIKYLNDATTYVDLVSKLDHWQAQVSVPINYITFNYDTLLERAIERCQTKPPNVQGFGFYEEFNVFKPHGSIGWSREIRFDADRNDICDRFPSPSELQSLKLEPTPSTGQQRKMPDCTQFATMPAIAIPVVIKLANDFVFTPGREGAMLTALSGTTAMLVIGWAAAEQHFMGHVAAQVQAHIPVLVVCGKGGDATCESLRTAGNLTNVVNAKCGFAEFLDSNRLESWLKELA